MARRTLSTGKLDILKVFEVLKPACEQVAGAVRQQLPDFDSGDFFLKVQQLLLEMTKPVETVTPISASTNEVEDAELDKTEQPETVETSDDSDKDEEEEGYVKAALAAYNSDDRKTALKLILSALKTGELAEIVAKHDATVIAGEDEEDEGEDEDDEDYDEGEEVNSRHRQQVTKAQRARGCQSAK